LFEFLIKIRVYDTKLLSNDQMIESMEISSRMNLEELYKHMRKIADIKIISPPGFEDYTKDGSFHEAGYDAFCTGCAFTYLKQMFGQTLLDKNVNKIRLMKVNTFTLDLANYENDQPILDVN
jgi:CAF1 family ribonuclease